MGFYFDQADEKKRRYVGLRMEAELFQALEKEAEHKALSLSQYIRLMLRDELNDNGSGFNELQTQNTLQS